ncbi:girdin-like isoform X2 [Penaeus japonicus]|uniref:girdin-like isoform X2 n=1 Tax=Penaeus japonicus TaxID=27405 RepID=UPI001C715C04|nr:girdin-like isoform X2 [Penaeus japonicus]
MASDPIKEFMDSALVTWVRTFESDGGGGLTYAALADGVFLYDVMSHIDPRGGSGRQVNRHPSDAAARLSNLAALLHHIKAFYQDVLNQSVVLRLPDVVKVSRAGEGAAGVPEVRQLLLLVLGCAVQSPRKEDVIDNIKKLDLDTQHSIVECIKEVTDNPEAVWPSEWSTIEAVPEDQLAASFNVLVRHCRRLAQERDGFHQDLLRSVCGERDEEDASQESVHHLGVQLADCKAQLRRLRQEYEEKAESIAEYKDELEQTKTMVAKLRQENVELVQDARAARAWRDEADILRERASRVEALEQEVARYRDKMADIEFYKTRVEELREDNRILVETKEMLEEQLASSRRRAEQVLDLENNILQLKQTVNQISIERDAERERLQEVMEENAQLQLSNKNSLSESATLVAQLDHLKSRSPLNGSSVGSDLIGDAQARVLKLQLENQRLEAEVEQLKRDSLLASADKLLELEKENKRLSIKVTQLQEVSQKERSQVLETQEESEQRHQEVQRLHQTLNTVKTNSQRQIDELQQENTQLVELIEGLRERQKKTTDTRLLDVETENKKLQDINLQLQSQVSRLEYEKQQLNRLTERLRESADKLSEVEHQKNEIERENRDLQKAITALRESCEKHETLEHDYASLEVEYSRVSKTLANMRETVAKLESAQSDKLQMQVEVERLNRSMDSLRSSSVRLADLESEKETQLQQINLLQQEMTSLKAQKSRAEQAELELLTANNEVQKKNRTLDTVQKKLAESEKEKAELENENSKLHRTVETLKLSTKKLNDMERDLTELESTNDRLDRENKSLQKEVSRLRNAMEVKDGLIDDAASKISTQERDIKRLNKDVEQFRTSDNRVRELEKEKRELEQQMMTERKTLSCLREDLVAEKVKTQQLSNQLDSLRSDLSKLGLNADNLTAPASDNDDDRYKALESMLEETLKRSVEVREEKIASLESRLNESVSRNKELRKHLMEVKSDFETLRQRHQEEGIIEDVSKEVAKLRESVYRTNEEKGSLENEIAELKSQAASYREQVCALQSQVTSLSNQNTVLSQHNATLQGENARLQVESTTLQSQSASLIAQNSALQSSATQSEGERDKVRRTCDERGSRLNQLVSDHEALQRLHQQLTREYDSLIQEHNNLKTSHRNLKLEQKELKEKQSEMSAGEEDLLKLREALEAEMSKLKTDSTSLANLRGEHSRLKDDFRSLFSANEKLRSEYKSLQGDYKSIKTENNTVKLRLTELNGELNDTRDQMAALDVEVSKLNNKCQVLQTLNVTLEEDRRSLMSQVSLLLTQYHDLLTQTLEDKQHFHQEEKNFTDKLNNLRRQKEKLEEKIMEQYRRMDNSPSKKLSPGCVPYSKGFGSNLVRRVRKAGTELINKVPRSGRSRSRGRDEGGESPDSSSLGSSSHANDSMDSGSETRRSSPNLPPSPPHDSEVAEQRMGRNGQTPNHYRKSLPPLNDVFASQILRGSVSSEDVGSLQSGDASDSHQEDSLSTVTAGSGTAELSRAGSRRPVYLTEDSDSIPTRDVGPEPLQNNQNRGRASLRSNASSSMSQQVMNRSYSNVHSSLPPSTPRTPTPGGAPRSSTPKTGVRKERAIDDEPPTTPRLPPRADHSSSAPQVPPRSRRGSSIVQPDSLSSSHSTPPEIPDLKPPKPPPRPPPSSDDAPLKQSKDIVDNSVWYEYGCV